MQVLLNLAEFMEHDEKPLPIDIRTLGALARKCHAYAKALHYKEMEFQTSPHTAIEELIVINNKLGQREAAVGILKHAQLKYVLMLCHPSRDPSTGWRCHSTGAGSASQYQDLC